MKMSQITKELEIQLARYIWDIIIWNRVVLDTHIVGKISLPQKHWDKIIHDQILLSWISDSSLVWDIYILETRTNHVSLTLTLTLQTLTLTLKWKCLK